MSPLLLILAGGEGRRMGGDKAYALLDGRTLLERSLDWAARQGLPVALSVRTADQLRASSLPPLVFDRLDIGGPLAGIVAGITAAKSQDRAGIVTIPIDMPWLPRDLVARLCLGTVATVAVSGGRWHPVCAYWPTDRLAEIEAVAAAGTRSLRAALESIGADPVTWPSRPRDPFTNINDPAALALAEEAFKARGKRPHRRPPPRARPVRDGSAR